MVALLCVASATAQELSQGDKVTCAIDGVRAVDDVLDGVVYTVSAIARCDTKSGSGDTTHCILDVTQVVESVNKMLNIILKAVDRCGSIKDDKPGCAVAVGTLTKSVASLTAASTGIVANCPNPTNSAGWGMTPHVGGFTRHCEVNIKDSVKSLMKAVKRAMSLKGDCTVPGSVECAHNGIKLANALVALAEYIAGAVGKCTANPAMAANGGCAQMGAKLTHAVGAVAEAGTGLARFCAPTAPERLYLATVDAKEDAASLPAATSPTFDVSGRFLASTATIAIGLAATAVVFIAGKKRSPRTEQHSQLPVAEAMLDEDTLE